MSNEILTQLTESLVLGEPEAAVELTRQALQSGLPPLEIIQQGLIPGMNIVGEKFQSGEYFLPDLIIAADGMQQAMQILEPALVARQEKVETAGTVVIGTVKGDIHEIGKSLVGTMLSANGFTVQADDTVTVLAANCLADPARWIAFQVVNHTADTAIVLRGEDGLPLWKKN